MNLKESSKHQPVLNYFHGRPREQTGESADEFAFADIIWCTETSEVDAQRTEEQTKN